MITAALVLLAIAAGCFLVRALLGPTLADRVVAIDALAVTIVAIVVVNSIRVGTRAFLDVAVVVALVGFLGTVAGARFIERRGG